MIRHAFQATVRSSHHGRAGTAKLVNARHFSVKLSDVELTSARFKNTNLTRGSFAVLHEDDLKHFERILDKHRVLTDETEVLGHNVDWLRMVRGRVVLKPKSTAEVSEILKHCHQRNLAVVPQGGNTGIVGGGVPVFDEIVVSTSLMNSIISFDEVSGTLVCQAGCILEILTAQLEERYGWTMPLDLGAKGSCQIGGNISTNAGGLRVVRYGSLHSTVLGLEAVLPDGTILDCMSTMKKDNTGYDLKHLFIGSEGTLGIVTQVAIQCPVKPKSINCTILGLQNFSNVIQSFKFARRDLNEIISSFEYMDMETMKVTTERLGLKWVLPEFPFYVLLEVSGSNQDHDNDKLEKYLQNVMESKIVEDGIVASSENDRQAIWELRERAAEALNKDQFFYSYDVSIPVEQFEQIIIDLRKEIASTAATHCCGFGHLGDGNIHVNVTSPEYDHDVLAKIEPFLYEWVAKFRGSISSEHGLGFKKKQFLPFSKPDHTIQVMKQIKKLFDPKGILNPYKVLP